jgi:hypothetical protein
MLGVVGDKSLIPAILEVYVGELQFEASPRQNMGDLIWKNN